MRPSHFAWPNRLKRNGMLGIDQRLGLAVAALLVEIGFDRVAAEMPDDGRRAEADGIAGILQAPADVDIVAGGAIDRIEAAEPQQRSRRNAMLQPAMCSATSSLSSTWVGPPGDTATAAGTRLSSGGGKLGPPQADEAARFHLGDQIGQPVGIGDAVAVGIGDDLAGRGLGADIAGDAQALVRLADDPAVADSSRRSRGCGRSSRR